MALDRFKQKAGLCLDPLTSQDRLRIAQITQIYNQSAIGGYAASIGAVIFAWALWNAEPHALLIVWALLYVVHFAFHNEIAQRQQIGYPF